MPTTFTEVLAAQLRRDPGRPLLTFYDHASDERVELSVTTYANWVAKASGLLSDVADLERGMSLRIDLPPHWLSPVFLGAAWTLGLKVTTSDQPDAVVCGPEGLDVWAPRAGVLPVLACSLRPLGVRFADALPAGVLDVGVEIWSQPDGFTAWDPPTGDDLATDTLTQQQLFGPPSDRPHDLTAAVGGRPGFPTRNGHLHRAPRKRRLAGPCPQPRPDSSRRRPRRRTGDCPGLIALLSPRRLTRPGRRPPVPRPAHAGGRRPTCGRDRRTPPRSCGPGRCSRPSP